MASLSLACCIAALRYRELERAYRQMLEAPLDSRGEFLTRTKGDET
jgi:hypothetical protein